MPGSLGRFGWPMPLPDAVLQVIWVFDTTRMLFSQGMSGAQISRTWNW